VTNFPVKSLALTACSAVVLAGVLAGCSSSGGSSGSKLSKADFVTQANAACASTLAKVKAAPTPSSLTDYANIISFDQVALKEEAAYLKTITALVDRSPDAAELHKNWVDLDSAQFAAQKPLVEKMNAAAAAKNQSQLAAAANQVAALPDNSAKETSYLNKYGLTDCAALANYGND